MASTHGRFSTRPSATYYSAIDRDAAMRIVRNINKADTPWSAMPTNVYMAELRGGVCINPKDINPDTVVVSVFQSTADPDRWL